jgi:hypothetical protein
MSADSPQADVSPEILDYLRQQTSLTLATASPGGIPRATTLRYASDGVNIYVWLRSGAAAAKHMAANPVVSFAIDSEGQGLQGTGEAHPVLTGDEIAQALRLFGEKYAGLARGSSQTAALAFFRIEPLNVKLVDESYAGGRGETQLGELEYRQQAVYDVFGDLPVQTAAGITAKLKSMSVDAGEVIARAGAPADKFFIVVEGAIEVVPEGENGDGGERLTLTDGDFFGELAVLRDTPRRATATATAPTKLLALGRDDFTDLVAQSLGMPENFDTLLRERLGGGEKQ